MHNKHNTTHTTYTYNIYTLSIILNTNIIREGSPLIPLAPLPVAFPPPGCRNSNMLGSTCHRPPCETYPQSISVGWQKANPTAHHNPLRTSIICYILSLAFKGFLDCQRLHPFRRLLHLSINPHSTETWGPPMPWFYAWERLPQNLFEETSLQFLQTSCSRAAKATPLVIVSGLPMWTKPTRRSNDTPKRPLGHPCKSPVGKDSLCLECYFAVKGGVHSYRSRCQT